MINRVVLVGRMTKDPELRKTDSGTSVATFTLALDNRLKDKDGNKTTSFIPCVIWKEQAENVTRFTHKGSLVGVEGRLNQRSYQNKEGNNVQIIEVVCDSVQFLEPKKQEESTTENTNNNTNDIDDLPF